MTKEALRQMQLVIETSQNPNEVSMAKKVANILNLAMKDKLLPEVAGPLHSKFSLDRDTHKVTTHRGDQGNLGPIKSDLLFSMMAHMGHVVTPRMFVGEVTAWSGFDSAEVNHSLKVHVSGLRRELGKLGLEDETFYYGYILTVPKNGYVLVDTAVSAHKEKYARYIHIPGAIKRTKLYH